MVHELCFAFHGQAKHFRPSFEFFQAFEMRGYVTSVLHSAVTYIQPHGRHEYTRMLEAKGTG